jgi:hypothetical protein
LTKGFQVGTTTQVNLLNGMYFWFAFKQGDNFKVGSYPGSSSAQDIEIAEGFSSDLIWTKSSFSRGAIAKPSTLVDPASQYFLGTANANTQITAITDNAFNAAVDTIVIVTVANWLVIFPVPEYVTNFLSPKNISVFFKEGNVPPDIVYLVDDGANVDLVSVVSFK